jgi:hypothetical protein
MKYVRASGVTVNRAARAMALVKNVGVHIVLSLWEEQGWQPPPICEDTIDHYLEASSIFGKPILETMPV